MIEGRLIVKFKLPRKIMAGESIDSGPPMVDLSKCLKGWTGKARTMRQQISPPVLDSSGLSSSDQDNAHSQQVLISSEASVQPDHLDSEEKMTGFSDDCGNLKRKSEETVNGPGRGDKIQKTDSGVDSPIISGTGGADHDGEIRDETETDIIKNSDEISLSTKTSSGEGCADDQAADNKNQGVSSSDENDAPMAPKTPKKYACSFCGKTFSSHLALGGHKSSHKKLKIVIYNAIDHRPKKQSMITNTCDQQTGKIASSGESAASQGSVVGDDRTHTCKICFKKFSSGQALGGHQRRHWSGTIPDQKTGSAPKILDFDLDELPKEEDEDPSSKC